MKHIPPVVLATSANKVSDWLESTCGGWDVFEEGVSHNYDDPELPDAASDSCEKDEIREYLTLSR